MAASGRMASFALSKRVPCLVKPQGSLRFISTLPLRSNFRRERWNCNALETHPQSRHVPFQCNHYFSGGFSTSASKRSFSSWGAEYEGLLAQRNKNIIMHPEGYGQRIMPGNYVIKKHPKTGVEKRVFLEHALGFFWAFKVGMLPLDLYVILLLRSRIIFMNDRNEQYLSYFQTVRFSLLLGSITYRQKANTL